MLTQRGFTLIELMITIVILGILLFVGLPAYTHWMQNLKIRSGAEAVQNGLQLARSSAIARNARVHFVFTADSDLGYMVYSPVSPTNLPADFRDPTSAPINLVRQYRQAEDAAGASVAVTPPPPNSYMVTFGALGNVVINPDGSNTLTQVDIDSAAMSGDTAIRPLRIVINPGGSTRTCDPKVTDPTDPRRC